MDLLAKKLSVIAALAAMTVAIVVGGLSGIPVEVVLLRGGVVFLVMISCSMVLMKLALKDREQRGDGEKEEEK